MFPYPYNNLAPKYFSSATEILGQCNLLNHDYSWKSLYNFFLPYANFEFSHHQRLLILDHDTDYYPDEQTVGNNLFNLVNLFSKLDISTNHIVILTANYGLEKDVKSLCDRYNLGYPTVVEFSQWYVYPPVNDLVVEEYIENFSHLYINLNYCPRAHRMIMMAMLEEKNLLDLGIVSWHARQDITPEVHPNLDEKIDSNGMWWHFRSTDPFTRINEDLNLCRRSINLTNRHQSLLNTTKKHPLITSAPHDPGTNWIAEFFNHALIFLITETVGQYRHVYFSEKTWKAIASKKPFLLLGAKNSLATLRQLGFMTFHEIWDESYDLADSVFERADLISDVLLKLSKQDWHDIAQRCQHIVKHNYNNLATLQKIHLEQLKYI